MLSWNPADLSLDEAQFRGTARLLPLPDLVLFPHVVQPLHIDEPRYCQLLGAALDSDGLIGMSVLAPGTNHPDKLLSQACLAKVVTYQRQQDGCYNVLLVGLRRFRIEEELPSEKPYREAKVALLEDCTDSEHTRDYQTLQTELLEKFRDSLTQEHGPVDELLSAEIPLEALTDLMSFSVPLEHHLKCQLLGEVDVQRRAELLLQALRTNRLPSPRGDSHLPPFSAN
jgi:Lon protease-like protein